MGRGERRGPRQLQDATSPPHGAGTPTAQPPRTLEALLRGVLPRGVIADSIVGDLREEHAHRAARSTRSGANRWYVRQALGIALRGALDRVRGSGPFTTHVRRPHSTFGDIMLPALFRSLKHGLRGLLRAPQFTLAAVLTLGLAIGTNAAIFSVVQGVLLKPLPFAEPERLVMVRHSAPGLGYDRFGMSPGLYWRYSEGASAFEAWGLYATSVVNVTGADAPPGRLVAASLSRDVLPALGVAPLRGRVFGEGEAVPDGASVVLLSHGLWQERFGGADVLGETMEVNGTPRTIIGIMPERFTFPNAETRLWLPLDIDPATGGVANFSYNAVARLLPGIGADEARARLIPVLTRLREDAEGASDDFRAFMERGQLTTLVTPLKEDIVGDVSRALWILLGTVAFVFLIACANVANLFLVRAETRHREMAVRAALGGGRAGLVGHYLAEALLIAALGGIIGLLLSWTAVRALVGLAPPGIPRLHEVAIDPVVLAFTFTATLLGALLLGLLPALRLTSPALMATLSRAARSATAGRQHNHVRNALVVAQTALALVLLIGSGLMVRSFQNLQAVEPGFDPANTTTFRIALPVTSYPDALSVAQFHGALLDRLRALPGITGVGATSQPPLVDCCTGTAYVAEDAPVAPGDMPPILGYASVTPGWFEALRIPLREGRTFETADVEEARRTVVVAEMVARRFWPDGSAVGRRIRPSAVSGDDAWYTIVGVVGNLRERGLDLDPYPMVYLPVETNPADFTLSDSRNMLYVVRTERADDVAALARAEVWAIDSELPVTITGSYQKLLANSLVRVSFTMTALVVAALIALVLGVIGLYSVISYVVAQRTNEIGIRLALGAQPAEVLRMLVTQGGLLVLVGIAIGMGGALALTRLMQGVLYGTDPTDPLTFVAVTALLGSVALLAAYVPARRASRIDPAGCLREG